MDPIKPGISNSSLFSSLYYLQYETKTKIGQNVLTCRRLDYLLGAELNYVHWIYSSIFSYVGVVMGQILQLQIQLQIFLISRTFPVVHLSEQIIKVYENLRV